MARKDITVENINESEKLLDTKMRRLIKKAGGEYIKLDTRFYAGLPDRLILIPRRKVIFAEVKSTGFKPKKLQLYVHGVLRRLGFDVRVIDSTAGINRLKEDYLL